MDFDSLLKLMIDKRASDLFITRGVPPSLKINGRIVPVGKVALSGRQAAELVEAVMDDQQRAEFHAHHELNFAITSDHVAHARFRVSAFYQRNDVGMVLRLIESRIPSVEELHLPPILNELVMAKRGIIFLVGATGTGKSTSLAAMIEHRNHNSRGHIISVEDPIEFIHEHAGCIVTQREVGIDTDSYEVALKNTLRQAPDVILIGEVRTRETMENAITFAETGHLVLTTLHANNANQALDRIINFFPEDRHKQLFLDLSLNLRGIVSQRLIPTVDGKRAAAIEILLGTPRVCDLVKNGKVDDLKEVMERSETQGMRTFDSALYQLHKDGKISLQEALQNADSVNNLRLKIQLDAPDGVAAGAGSGLSLALEPEAKAESA